jgi:iduronate 2-sulfatase
VTFTRAYVQQGICAPSRASFLSGCRPDTTGVDFPYTQWYANEFLKEHPSLMRFFHDRGWYTKTYQKVHHGAVEQGFSEPNMKGKYELWGMAKDISPHTKLYGEAPQRYRNSYYDTFWQHLEEAEGRGEPLGIMACYKTYMLPYDAGTKPDGSSADDTGYVAGQNVEDAMEVMTRVSTMDQPFFIALGMANTHYPFISPKKYWDLYSDEDLHFAKHDTLSKDVYQGQLHSDARAKYAGWQHRGQETDEYKTNLLRGYYAAVSYQDALMGQMFDHLKAIGEWDNTIICVIGDHGYHLGEHSHWGKYSCFDIGLRTTMMWKPQKAAGVKPGTVIDRLVEFVDLYPTLNELAGFEPADYLEGLSTVPLMKNPDQDWKRAVFSQKVLYTTPNGSRGEGYSVRTDQFRYTEFRSDWAPNRGAREGELLGAQLFDLNADPDETTNLVNRPEYKELIRELSALLADRNSWKTCLPQGVSSKADNPHGHDEIYADPEKGAPYKKEPRIIPE